MPESQHLQMTGWFFFFTPLSMIPEAELAVIALCPSRNLSVIISILPVH